MNFLAHLYIAEQRDADPAGAVLGDVVRGRDLGHLPQPVGQSIQLHRRIDAVCDRHPATRDALRRFPPGPRRYAGIVLDLCADHLLARNWGQWHHRPLAEFCAAMAEAVAANGDAFAALQRPPPEAARFAKVLEDVQHEEGIDRALLRISERARDPARLLAATRDWQRYVAVLEPQFPQLLRDCMKA